MMHCVDAKRRITKRAADDICEEQSYAFKVSEFQLVGLKHRGLMVNTGATWHIMTDIQKFLKFDELFQPQNHSVELADGARTNGVVVRRGDAGGLRGEED